MVLGSQKRNEFYGRGSFCKDEAIVSQRREGDGQRVINVHFHPIDQWRSRHRPKGQKVKQQCITWAWIARFCLVPAPTRSCPLFALLPLSFHFRHSRSFFGETFVSGGNKDRTWQGELMDFPGNTGKDFDCQYESPIIFCDSLSLSAPVPVLQFSSGKYFPFFFFGLFAYV